MQRRDLLPLSLIASSAVAPTSLNPPVKNSPLSRKFRSALGIACAVTLTLSYAGGAWAQNMAFLRNSPLTYMRDKDMASLKTALAGVLDNSADGQSTEWTNEGTGNSVAIKATLTPKDTDDQNGMHCRHVAVAMTAKGQDQGWLPLFCKTAQGWKIAKH